MQMEAVLSGGAHHSVQLFHRPGTAAAGIGGIFYHHQAGARSVRAVWAQPGQHRIATEDTGPGRNTAHGGAGVHGRASRFVVEHMAVLGRKHFVSWPAEQLDGDSVGHGGAGQKGGRLLSQHLGHLLL
jgi:hypothetical protein